MSTAEQPRTAAEETLREELDAERAYAAECRAALTRLVEDAQRRVHSGAGVLHGEGVSGNSASAEALGRELRSRAKELREEQDGPPFFGRLDFTAGAEAGEHRGQRYYIGRRRLREHPSAPPLVLDWRAPVSRAFYQAGTADPQGVAVRRRFGWAPYSSGEPGELTGLEDELLDGGGEFADAGEPAPRSAPASRILAEEIERPRIGPMRDIVATIQPEQDALVRADFDTSICVQGGPGTGKTAVGLHRAAYLLYTHPGRLRRGGLLVLGPNRTFLRYISQVLPALGESDVRQCTLGDLLALPAGTGARGATAVDATAADTTAAERLKHGARMAEVLRRALYARVRPADGPLAVPDGSYRWRLDAGELTEVVSTVRAEEPPYLVGRERVRARVAALLRAQAERRAGPPGAAWLRRISRARPVTALLDAVWPKARPAQVVAELLGDAEVLASAAEGLLSADEQAALLWRRPPRSPRSARWSPADLLLLDEVAGLLERPEGYGHVVVDEAQDLSPMECRAIARRSAHGSLTVLGDLAQGTTPWAAREWSAQLGHLGAPEADVTALTTGFRVPAAVVAAANRLLGGLNVPVPPTRSLRDGGELRVHRVAEPARLVSAAVESVRAASARAGSVGVLAADGEVPAVRAALEAAGLLPEDPAGAEDGTDPTDPAGPEGSAAGAASGAVTVLPAALAKGLEYDHVVLLEPAAVAEPEPHGLHRLYVALTRAVSTLDIVHCRPLPVPLAADGDGDGDADGDGDGGGDAA